jgi:hypothetical protein
MTCGRSQERIQGGAPGTSLPLGVPPKLNGRSLSKQALLQQDSDTPPFYVKLGLWCSTPLSTIFQQINILIPNVAEKNILILVEEKKII